MSGEDLQAALAIVRDRFYVELRIASQRAKWSADDPGADPNTCRFCGKHWRKWAGSKLDGHSKCIVSEDFKRWLRELANDPAVTYAALGEACGVSLAVTRSWIMPIAGAR